MHPYLVLGLGNILMRDEGFGVYVAKLLAQNYSVENIEILEGTTSGISLMREIENRKKIIVIDAIQANEAPGTLFCFNQTEIEKYYRDGMMSFHQLDFIQVLEFAKFLNIKHSEMIFLAIQPADVSPGLGLSDIIEERVQVITDLVRIELLKAEKSMSIIETS